MQLGGRVPIQHSGVGSLSPRRIKGKKLFFDQDDAGIDFTDNLQMPFILTKD